MSDNDSTKSKDKNQFYPIYLPDGDIRRTIPKRFEAAINSCDYEYLKETMKLFCDDDFILKLTTNKLLIYGLVKFNELYLLFLRP